LTEPRSGVENRCPVCQARFRRARVCSRCGADLEPLMRLQISRHHIPIAFPHNPVPFAP